MSLSKYYEKTDAFKREEIVQQEQTKDRGWQPLPQHEKQPFKTNKIVEKQVPSNESLQSVTETEAEVPPVATNKDISPESTAPITPSVPAEELLDPSQYLSRHDADQQIADAYQNGVIEGEKKVIEDYGVGAKLLSNICQQLDTIRETIISNSSSELQDFAIAIAERIIRTSVEKQDHTIIATIEEALHRAVRSEEFTIFINPDDYAIVEAKSPDLIVEISGLSNVVIKQDITIERGGAKIESENCTIDASIASQFDAIHKEVKRIK